MKNSSAPPPENRPLQLVSTGNAEDDYSFVLQEDNLDRVLSKVTENVQPKQSNRQSAPEMVIKLPRFITESH